MDKTLKRKWLKALRSGKFRQGQNGLRTPTTHGGHVRHCCLGVLCEVMKLKVDEEDRFYYISPIDKTDMLAGSLGENVLKLVGITDKQETALIDMNDGNQTGNNPEGKTYKFHQIADWIEENL